MPSTISIPSTLAEIFCSHRKASGRSGPRTIEIRTDHPIWLSADSTPRSTSSMNSRPSCSMSVSGLRLSIATSPITSLRLRTILCAELSGT
ncbi:MAG: hypothetical protein ACRDOC_07925 [Streptosporangiaceae bacterium]